MIPYDELMKLRPAERVFRWSERDAMLYAVSIGMGQDPLDERELRYVFERDLQVMPTFATVAAWGAQVSAEAMGVNYLLVVQSDQKVEIHRPLPAEGRVIAASRVAAAIDKGPKGAIVTREVVLRDAADDKPIATLTASIFARGDGGFGGPTEGGAPAHTMPDRDPDRRLSFATRPEQALLYRLTGDRNPLHADPDAARRAKFDRPILHGLCTYGIMCRAVLAAFPEVTPEQIVSHEARFSAPMFPGETVDVALWREGDLISFEASVAERSVAVIRNGRTQLRLD